MNDCDKLKEACELAEKYYEQTSHSVVIESNYAFGCHASYKYVLFIDKKRFMETDCIERLITELHKLLNPKSKYQIGQLVWTIGDDNDPSEFLIREIDHEDKTYSNDFRWVFEDDLYSSKAELIKAQCDYWESFRCDGQILVSNGDIQRNQAQHDVDRCQHEPDERCNRRDSAGKIFQCIKCGEFYR